MRVRSIVFAAVLCALAIVAVAPAASAQTGFIPVANQALDLGSAGTGTLTAVKITKITNQGGQLLASGLATVTTSTGTAIGSFTNAPLAATQIPTGPNTMSDSPSRHRSNFTQPPWIGGNGTKPHCAGHHGCFGSRKPAWQSALRSRQPAEPACFPNTADYGVSEPNPSSVVIDRGEGASSLPSAFSKKTERVAHAKEIT
jgi:hypothetical protein